MLRLSVLLFLILMNVSFILYSFIFDIEYTQELVRLEIAKKYTQNNNFIKVSDQNNFIKTKNIRKQYNSLNKVVQNNKAIQNYDKLLYEFELYLTELKSNTITLSKYPNQSKRLKLKLHCINA